MLIAADMLDAVIISSIAAGFPSLRVTNDDLLQQVERMNKDLPSQQVAAYCKQIGRRLRQAGAEVRFYRNHHLNEAAYPILMDAIHSALQKACLKREDIDLLIYCGVGRGFLEPAMAYFVASDLGISCECFDIIDACMSWVRALYIVYNLFAAGRYSHALVVNAEFNIYESGYPALMKIDLPSKWKHTFPAFAVGEAATATVLSASDLKWNFYFKSFPTNVNLCTLPLKSYLDYSSNQSNNLAPNGPNKFMCFGEELSRVAKKEMMQFVSEIYPTPRRFKKWFPHVATADPYSKIEQALGLDGILYTKTFPRYGNLVSASIPVALLSSSLEGELERGDPIVLCPISAGMSMALVDFVY